MSDVYQCTVPANSLLQEYNKPSAGVDCYCTQIPGVYSHQEFIVAFYSSSLFKLERFILRCLVNKPSPPGQLERLVSRDSEKFAVWHVEQWSDNQLLLCDDFKRTRSWLMTQSSTNSDGGDVTLLYFGSAVIHSKGRNQSVSFRLLSKFHHYYSLALLSAAKKKLLSIG